MKSAQSLLASKENLWHYPQVRKKKKEYFSDSVFKSNFPELIAPLTCGKLNSLNLTFGSTVSGVKILSSIIPEVLKQGKWKNYEVLFP